MVVGSTYGVGPYDPVEIIGDHGLMGGIDLRYNTFPIIPFQNHHAGYTVFYSL